MRARSAILPAAACAAALLGGCAERPLPLAKERDVVLITVDTLRADRLGAYGYTMARTPAIDALAARGRRFTQATTPFPRTTPAVASLMTGLWPQRHGSREVGQPMRDVPTLALWLAERGYRTIGITANPLAGVEQGLARGFDAFEEPPTLEGRVASAITDRALELVGEPDERPLFAWIHYLDPHFPYLPPADWEPQPAAPACRELGRAVLEGRLETGAVQGNVAGRAEAALAECSSLYDAEVAYVDAAVGRLLSELERRGVLDDAWVVLTSDHGENLGEEGLYYEHGPSLHDASLRVPLIVAGPGIAAGVDDGIVRLEDLPATLLGLLGLERESMPAMDGVDLSARLTGGASGAGASLAVAEGGSALQTQNFGFLRSGRAGGMTCVNGPRFSLCGEEGGRGALFDHLADPDLTTDLGERHGEARRRLEAAAARWGVERARRRSVRTPRFKLVERPLAAGGYARALYDLTADPAESRDVGDLHPDARAELEERLDAWTATLPEPEPQERSSGLLERLRSLGYLQ